MNAHPRPMAETHKLALLDWLRSRFSYGQGAPTDRSIASRFGLRSTDDALALVKQLEADGEITIEQQGITRHLVLRNPPPLAGAKGVTAEMAEAARTAVGLPPQEPVPVRAKPAPISIRPPRPLFTPVDIDPAPIAPIAPAVPKEEVMPAVATPVAPPPSIERARGATRHPLMIQPLKPEFDDIAARAKVARQPIAVYVMDVLRAYLARPAHQPQFLAAPGKPRLSARVLRIASADERGFWPAISMMIELGATALAAQQQGGQA